VYLAGFIIGIYHDVLSHERQIATVSFNNINILEFIEDIQNILCEVGLHLLIICIT
jgi:hypothetical protein